MIHLPIVMLGAAIGELAVLRAAPIRRRLLAAASNRGTSPARPWKAARTIGCRPCCSGSPAISASTTSTTSTAASRTTICRPATTKNRRFRDAVTLGHPRQPEMHVNETLGRKPPADGDASPKFRVMASSRRCVPFYRRHRAGRGPSCGPCGAVCHQLSMFSGESLDTFRMRSSQFERRWPWESKKSGANPLTRAVAISRFKSAFGDGTAESRASDDRMPATIIVTAMSLDAPERRCSRASNAKSPTRAGLVANSSTATCGERYAMSRSVQRSHWRRSARKSSACSWSRWARRRALRLAA